MPISLLGRWLLPPGVVRPAPAPSELLDLSPVAVTVQDTDGTPKAGLPVYAFNGTAYTGYSATTNSSGIATLSLPDGDYRFRSDPNGTQFWSGSENHCTVPGCESATIVVTIPVTVTVLDTDSQPVQGLSVYAFNGTAYTGYSRTTNASGEAVFTLPQGSYRFRSDRNGTQFWSATANHCDIPGCTSAGVTVSIPLVVTVRSTGGTPQAGLPVYAFNGATYTGYSRTTDASGEAVFTLPQGPYRFRSDRDGTHFWSGEANHCDVPGCLAAEVVVTLPVTVTVLDTGGSPQAGLPVYAFGGDTYTGFSGTTDDLGDVPFTLPEGSYRFRADLLGTQFWSGETNHCDVPGCESVLIEVTSPLVVTVLDTDGTAKEGLPVYAFDGETYTGFNASTNAAGEATFVLPVGSYRFRSDLNGTQFWSGEANHCDIPGCVAASVTVTIPVTVSVENHAGTAYPDLPVYAFVGDTYTGFNGTSDAEGNVVFTLPVGEYRFRADLDGVQFWSGEVATCTVPGCTEDLVPIPGGTVETDVTIDYTYDPLYRLTAADYSTGEFFHYTYDAVGNRLTQGTEVGTNSYTYDIANRLISLDGVDYLWDDNGNLLSDGTSTYSYDPANRLRTVDQGGTSYTFLYDGLGNRVAQIVSDGNSFDYTLDLAAGLTQVLTDGTNTYLYGLARIVEEQPDGWQYHLGDALGSVRELTDSTGTVDLAQSFEPFGRVVSSFGSASTAYSFTGEQLDGTGLLYLRARYLSTGDARFVQPDPWGGDPLRPGTLSAYAYSLNNPMFWSDPSGECPICLLVLLLGLSLTGCSVDDTPETTARNASFGLQVYDSAGGYGWSIGSYLGNGDFITHDHFTEFQLPQPEEAPRVEVTDAAGGLVGILRPGSIHLLRRESRRYSVYSVDGGVMEAGGFTAAVLGDGSEVTENQTVTSVRWQGGLPGGAIEAFSAAVAEVPSQASGLGFLIQLEAETTSGDSGAGLWRDSRIVGVLRSGAQGSGRTTYALYFP